MPIPRLACVSRHLLVLNCSIGNESKNRAVASPLAPARQRSEEQGGISQNASCGCPVPRVMRSQKCDGCIATRRRAVNCGALVFIRAPESFSSPRQLTAVLGD